MLRIRIQREILRGGKAARAASLRTTAVVGATLVRGACNWRAAASLPETPGQGRLIAPEVSSASPNQQAALM
jgi:hypothetical protein